MDAIKVNMLTKDYRTKVKGEGLMQSVHSLFRPEYREVRAVDEITFSVAPGEMLAFIGPNGAGKSTAIKMLTGILQPTGGHMRVLGLDPAKQRRELASRIGTVFGQRSQLWLHLPPVDSFAMLGAIYGIDDATRKKRVDELAQRFELTEFLRTPVRRLSLGQRIRCEIAASLLHEPQLLFLDEPTIGLALLAQQHIRESLAEQNRERGVTVVLTSHDPSDVEEICRRAIVIDRGRIILDRPIGELKTDYFHRKTISVRYAGAVTGPMPSLPGAVICGNGTERTVTLDTRLCSAAEAIHTFSALGSVADITVTDPPMEPVISDIFRRKGELP